MKPERLKQMLALALACGVGASVATTPTRADDAQDAPADDGAAKPGDIAARPNQVRGDELTPQQQEAVRRGLEWLAVRQKQGDGAYSSGIAGYGNHAGITALAGLAFMQAGNLPGRGKYGKEVQHCLDFVLASCQENGLIAADNGQGPMYGHGFATLFLAEIYGMTGDPSIKEKLQKAVKLIENTQNGEGGWRYQPAPLDADISVTICEIMALRAAHDAGIHVDDEVIARAVKYVKRCQNGDGGFSYMANMGGMGGMGGSAFPRSAAGVCALYYAGKFDDPGLVKGLQYLQQFGTHAAGRLNEGHFYYGYYYGTQAMFLAGGDYWAKFYPAIRDELIRRQELEPNRDHWSGDFSEDYATAMALIILQMPNRYLPVYNGKGPGS